MLYKLFDTKTGFWYVKGQGFSGNCADASILNKEEKKIHLFSL